MSKKINLENKFYQTLAFNSFNCLIVASDSYVERIILSEIKLCHNDKPNNITTRCAFQLSQYFLGERKDFDCPLMVQGTTFQKLVWEETRKIPYGQTLIYKELAERIRRPSAFRAVARALGANPLPIIIPCHRVIASSGIGGFSSGIKIKKFLLSLEGVTLCQEFY